MTLTTHSVIGAMVAGTLATQPTLAIIGAFGSHFLLDAIPHWDYRLLSNVEKVKGIKLVFGRAFCWDLFRVGLDALLGLVLSLVVWFLLGQDYFWLIIIGGLIATLPDYLQFVYSKFNWSILGWLQMWHDYCHTNYKLNGRFLLGIGSQGILIMVAMVSIYFLQL